MKIPDIYELSISNFVFSTLTSDNPAIFDDWFRYDHEVHDHTTRSSANVIRENYFDVGYVQPSFTLHTKGANNDYGRKMIQVSGPLIWNRIPEDIQKAGTIFTFKKHLKNHIFGQYRGDPEDNSNNINNNSSQNNNRTNSNNNRNRTDNQRWRQNINQPHFSRWDNEPEN